MMRKTRFLILMAIVAMLALPVAVAGEDLGYYEIRANVEGANVYFDGTFMGSIKGGLLIVPVDLNGPRYRTALLNKSGYEPYILPLTQAPAKGQTIVLHATLRADPQSIPCIIQVLSDPTGSEIVLDGTSLGTVPPSGVWINTDVSPGQHTLELKLAGFQTNTTNFYLDPGEELTINVVFTPITTGTLMVASVPTGASVYIDNIYRGLSPLTIPNVNAGSYQVTVRQSGYSDWTQPVQISPGATQTLTAQLQPIATQTETPTTRAALSPYAIPAAILVAGFLLGRINRK